MSANPHFRQGRYHAFEFITGSRFHAWARQINPLLPPRTGHPDRLSVRFCHSFVIIPLDRTLRFKDFACTAPSLQVNLQAEHSQQHFSE
jgi:hypothetical protein